MKIADDLVVWRGRSASVIFSASEAKPLFLGSAAAADLAKNDLVNVSCDQYAVDVLSAAGILTVPHETAVTGRERLRQSTQGRSESILKGETVRLLDLIVSEGCNFGCPHCIHSRDVTAGDARKINSYMSVDVAKAAIDEFCEMLRLNGHDELFVHIGSAEPLLNWKCVSFIVEYLDGITEFKRKRVTLNSNLSLLTREMALFLRRYNVILSTSLDGTQTDNDKIRILKNGSGTFNLVIQRIKELKDLGFLVDSVSLTVTDRNISGFDIDGYLLILESLGISGVSIDFDLVGSAEVPASVVSGFLLEFYDACRAKGIECYGTWTKPFENLFRHENEVNQSVLGFCKAVEGGNVSVSPQGNLHMCGYTSANLGRLGSIATDYPVQLSRLLERRAVIVEDHCTGCDLIKVCGGQCHATHEVSGAEGTEKIDIMCEIYRTVTRALALRKVDEEMLAQPIAE